MLGFVIDCLTVACLLLLLVSLACACFGEDEVEPLSQDNLARQLHQLDMSARLAAPALLVLTAAYLEAREDLLRTARQRSAGPETPSPGS